MDTADIGVFRGSGFYGFLEANVERVRSVLFELIPKIPNERTGCACADAVGPLRT